jgi:Tol biopolymer transport system component
VDSSAKILKTIEWRGTSNIAFSRDGKFLAYDLPVTSSSPQRDVFVVAVDGSRETPTVVHPADDRVVGWSPDGKTLLFSSYRSGAAGLWAMPMVAGKVSGPATLIKNDLGHGRALGVTASGSLYFGSKIAGPDIHVASVDFATGQMLTPPVNPVPVYTGSNQHPHWSPDGKFLAYISRRDTGGLNNVLCILSRETGEVREVRTEMAYVNRPRWSPDGRSLAVMGTDLKGRDGLFRIDVQTGGLFHLAVNEPGVNSNIIDWSRDGKRIFLTRATSDKGWAFVERDVASGAERIIAHRKDIVYGLAALSPDGKWFAMRAQDAASKDSLLLVMDVVDGKTRELLRVPRGVGVGGWAPDSTSVIVNRSGSGKPETWRVPLSGAAPTKLAFRVSSPGTPFSVHPDGRQIAYWSGGHVVEVWAIENFLQVPTAHQ